MQGEHTKRLLEQIHDAHVGEFLPLIPPKEVKQTLPTSSRAHDTVMTGRDTVARIERLLCLAEYKRRQAPPGVKLGKRNFGRDRRYPITNAFRTA